MGASSKEFLDIEATIECGFTLKHLGDMTETYLNLSLKVAPKLDRLRKKLNAIFDNEGLKSLLTQIYCNLFPCTEK